MNAEIERVLTLLGGDTFDESDVTDVNDTYSRFRRWSAGAMLEITSLQDARVVACSPGVVLPGAVGIGGLDGKHARVAPRRIDEGRGRRVCGWGDGNAFDRRGLAVAG